jgi:hypothetical protein
MYMLDDGTNLDNLISKVLSKNTPDLPSLEDWQIEEQAMMHREAKLKAEILEEVRRMIEAATDSTPSCW